MRSIQTTRSPHILLIRPDALGDVLLMLPMVMAIRTQWPSATLTVLANAYTAPLLEVHPAIDTVWIDPFDKGKSFRGMFDFIKKLKAARFDWVIHVFNEAPYVLATWLARIPVRVGDKQKLLLSVFHSHRVRQDFDNPALHEVELDLQLVRPLNIALPIKKDFGWNGVTFPHPFSPLPVPYVVIHPGVGKGNRCIPKGIYRALISELSGMGIRAILTGGQTEKQTNAEIIEGLEHVSDLTGQTDLLQLAGLLQQALLMISVDTGPMHLAASLGVRVLNLSPSKYVKPTRWGPYGVVHRVIRPEMICSYRCFPYSCTRGDCTEAFNVSTIRQAMLELLDPTQQPSPHWIQLSMPVLDLRQTPNPAEAEGYIYFQRQDVTGNIWRWVVIQDIGFILVDKRRFWHPLAEKILALWLYYPPRFVVKLTQYVD